MNNIPTNLEETIEAFDKMLKEEDKEYLIEHGELSVHHTLGTWIRNNWGLWNDSILKQNITKEFGLHHPDDISNYIIKNYIKYLEKNNIQRSNRKN